MDGISSLGRHYEEAVERGGGFARVTVTNLTAENDEDTGFDIVIQKVLWEAPTPLADLDHVRLREARVDRELLQLPIEAVAFITNDGVAWTMAVVDEQGCFSQAPGIFSLVDIVEIDLLDSLGRWARRVGVPTDPWCEAKLVPQQPSRHDEMIAVALDHASKVAAQRQRFSDARQLADQLGERNQASLVDIERQLLAGVDPRDLDFQPERDITIRLPGVDKDDYSKLIVVLHEGDPPLFSAWFQPNRRNTKVQLPIPRSDNQVAVYIGTAPVVDNPVAGFKYLPQDWECVDEYTDVEPYAVVPAEAFSPPNQVINLNKWRPLTTSKATSTTTRRRR